MRGTQVSRGIISSCFKVTLLLLLRCVRLIKCLLSILLLNLKDDPVKNFTSYSSI